MLSSLPPEHIAFAFAVLMAGGFVKGIHGIGLPMIALPMLSFILPAPVAIAVLSIPIITTNVYQIRINRGTLPLVRRFGGLLIALIAGIVIGATLLTGANHDAVLLSMGVMVLVFVASRAVQIPFVIPRAHEVWLGPLVGGLAGLLGGISSIYGPPVLIYVRGLGLDRERFTRVVGLIYVAGLTPLYVSLAAYDILGFEEAKLSVLALIPVFCGFFLGQKLRGRMSEKRFEQALLVTLLVVGVELVRRGAEGWLV